MTTGHASTTTNRRHGRKKEHPKKEHPKKHHTTVSKKPDENKKDDEHDEPALSRHLWFLEDKDDNHKSGAAVLTQPALDRIARHQYVSGTYTWLDMALNPVWDAMTVALFPAWLAPNVVTLLGALHCLAVYVVTWYYAPTGMEEVPAAVLIFNGYCLFASYTFDSMDGKQARRTKTSSPLGQLLDHGLDSLCLLAHCSANQAWLRTGDTLKLQLVLQFSFYLAQWEEYYTAVLPHATGQIGVTEVNYGLALVSLWHGWLQATTTSTSELGLYHGPAIDDITWLVRKGWLSRRLLDVLMDPVTTTTTAKSSSSGLAKLDILLNGWERRHLVLLSWTTGMLILCVLCLGRVMMKLRSTRQRWKAITQLITPVLVVYLASLEEFSWYNNDNDSETDETMRLVRLTIRWKSLAIGLLFCHLTIKVIVYSMARQSVAVIQWDALPPLAAAVALTVFDPRLSPVGHELVWQVMSAVWGIRLVVWNVTACRQICQRLNIRVWTITPNEKVE